MDRRRFLALASIGVTTPLAGCSGGDDDGDGGDGNNGSDGGDSGDSDNTDGQTDDQESADSSEDGNDDDSNDDGSSDDGESDEASEDDGGEEADEPVPQDFSGSGAEVHDDVEIEGGLTVVEATHTAGESNFQVELVPSEGEFNELFVNEIGEYDGASAALLDADTYQLDVEADGDWEISIYQPRASSGESLPASIEGEGPDVVGPYEFSGSHTATGSHSGESNFQVEVLPPEGDFGELVFNEIGEYEGETTFRTDGVGWIDVQADGEWSVEME